MPYQKKNVFCVDDDPEMLALIVMLLEEKGIFKVHKFTNAPAAFTAMADTKPDLILFDILMPGMDGFTAYRKLREIEELKDVKIVFVTASKSKAAMEQYKALGVSILTKPFDMTEFQNFVRSVL